MPEDRSNRGCCEALFPVRPVGVMDEHVDVREAIEGRGYIAPMARMAVTAATVFADPAIGPRADTTVVWEGERVVWVGPSEAADLAGTDVVTTGGFIVPGLIDAHVHLCLDGTLELIEGVVEEPVETTIRRSEESAATLLAAGVTSARDVGSREGVAVGVAERQRSGALTGARILAAGRGITPPGGHGWMIGVIADGTAAVADAVAEEIRRGARAVKLFPTGGILGSGSHGDVVTMSVDEVRAAVEVAHAHNVLVAAHVVGTPGIDVVLDGGVDTIEHAVGLTPEQAQRCAEQNTALVPTLTAVEMVRQNAAHLPADVVQRTEAAASRHFAGIATAIDAGVTVLAGTDAGTPFNPHGGLVTELELLTEAGMSPTAALSAATSASADTLRLADVGRITPGTYADLVVVDGDPLHDLGVLRNPALIIQGGGLLS